MTFLFHAHEHVIPAALALLPAPMRSKPATAMLLAVGLQESLFEHRRQVGGPARGYWQFERAGVRGVLTHERTEPHISKVLHTLNYRGASTEDCYVAIEHNDILAAVFALPKDEHSADIGWRQYLKAWRPGKPHPEKWLGVYGVAWDLVSCER